MGIRAAAPYKALFQQYDAYLRQLIETLKPRDVGDIGGGRNPQLNLDFVRGHGLEYTLLDISAEELAAAPEGYHTLHADIGSPEFDGAERFDFVFSRMVAEHIRDGRQFHANVFRALRPGGVAFHFFPTLYTAPFLANRLMPEAVSDRVLDLFAPRDRVQRGKFPAYYSWTYGPTDAQIGRLEGLGYEVPMYLGGFGHAYFRRVPGLKQAGERMARMLVRRPNYTLTSYAFLILRKPAAPGRDPAVTGEIPMPALEVTPA